MTFMENIEQESENCFYTYCYTTKLSADEKCSE